MADDIAGNALGNLFSAGASFAMGNPIGAVAGIAGLGLSIFGGLEKSRISGEISQAQQQISKYEQQQEGVRRQAMLLSARRQQIEVLRNQQRARSLALQAATTQGAQQGSGLQGGYGQIAGATQWNLAGITSNLDFGNQMFGLNAQISQQKQKIASLGGEAATAGGIGSIGSMLMGSVGNLGKLQVGGSFGLGSNSGNIPTYDTIGQDAFRLGAIR